MAKDRDVQFSDPSLFNRDAETALIGAALICQDSVEAALDLVDAKDFYDPKAAKMWEVIHALTVDGLVLSVDNIIVRTRNPKATTSYLCQCVNDYYRLIDDVGTFAQLVALTAQKRAIVQLAQYVGQIALMSPNAAVGNAQDAIERIIK